jgi:mannan polymerase II complex MNN11 subunit
MLRRSRVQAIVLGLCALGMLLFTISRIFGSSDGIPSGTPPVVIVTVLDVDHYGATYLESVKQNRDDYAKKHGERDWTADVCQLMLMLYCLGYATFFPTTTDYDLAGSPSSWSRVPAVRHALTKFPHSTWFWFLDQNSLIMNPLMTVEDNVVKKVESLMLKNHPIVPRPDSVIKTFSHLKANQIDLILTQDKNGLAQRSFLIRRGDWSKFFLDTWFDPLYRSYNFEKADAHALVCSSHPAQHKVQN